jgi:hypothetical protein
MQLNKQDVDESQPESGMESQESTNTDTRVEDRQLELENECISYIKSIVVTDNENKTSDQHADAWKRIKESERKRSIDKRTRFANKFNMLGNSGCEPPSNLARLEYPTIYEFSADEGSFGAINLGIQRDAGYRYAGDRGERKPNRFGYSYGTRAVKAEGRHTTFMPKQVFLAHRMDQDLSFALNQHFKVPEEDTPDRISVEQAQKILDSQIRSFNRQILRRNRLDRQNAIILWKFGNPRLLFPTRRLKVNILQSEIIRREQRSKTLLAKRAPEGEIIEVKTIAERVRKCKLAKKGRETSAERDARKAKEALQRKAQRAASKGSHM